MTPYEALIIKCVEAVLGAAVVILPALHWMGF